jgi:hypothetical protein
MRFNYQCLPSELNLFDVDLYFKFDLNSKLIQKHSSASISYNSYKIFGNINGTFTTLTCLNKEETPLDKIKDTGIPTPPKNTPLPEQTPPNESVTNTAVQTAPLCSLDTSMFDSILNYQPL